MPPSLTSLWLGDDEFNAADHLRASTGCLLGLDLWCHMCDWGYDAALLAGPWSQNLTFLSFTVENEDAEWPSCTFSCPHLQHLRVQLEADDVPPNVWDLAGHRLQCLTLEAYFNDEEAGTFPLNQVINVNTELLEFGLDLGNKGRRLALDFSTWQLQQVKTPAGTLLKTQSVWQHVMWWGHSCGVCLCRLSPSMTPQHSRLTNCRKDERGHG